MTQDQAQAVVDALRAGDVPAGCWFDTEWQAGGVWVIDWTTPQGYRVELRGFEVAISDRHQEPQFCTDTE